MKAEGSATRQSSINVVTSNRNPDLQALEQIMASLSHKIKYLKVGRDWHSRASGLASLWLSWPFSVEIQLLRFQLSGTSSTQAEKTRELQQATCPGSAPPTLVPLARAGHVVSLSRNAGWESRARGCYDHGLGSSVVLLHQTKSGFY